MFINYQIKGFARKVFKFSHGNSFKLGQMISPCLHKGRNLLEAQDFYTAVTTLCEDTSKTNQEKNTIWFWGKKVLFLALTQMQNEEKELLRKLTFQSSHKPDFE